MADLPKEILMSGDPPFSHVEVDYFGPHYVRQVRSNVKRFGCLFSCLVTRAAHIEVVHSLDTDGFINALRRFINIRGNPTTICSDNGTNFRAGEKEIREALKDWNQHSIYEFLRQRNVIWKFNPPAASHMGGTWERIIRPLVRSWGCCWDNNLSPTKCWEPWWPKFKGSWKADPWSQLAVIQRI